MFQASSFRQVGQTGLSIEIVACMVGKDNRDLFGAAIMQGETSAEEGMMNVNYIHGLQEFLRGGLVSQREIKARISQRQARVANDAFFIVPVIEIAEGKDVDLVSR